MNTNQSPDKGAVQSLDNLSKDQLLLLVKSMRAKLIEHEYARHEPIAVVGMACRFPGAPKLDDYWRLLLQGTDAVTEIPSNRWDVNKFYSPELNTPGKMYTKAGGFVLNPADFDPGFFGISPREATSMDPQQRLLLELAWESLENAKIPPSSLRETSTGVFVGISTNDYLQLGCLHADRKQIDAYSGTGSAASIAAGRLSYQFGFLGPTLTVDTACSSSLVATHLACNALRNGECQTALVGGVNLMLAPDTTIYFCKVRALSIDGRCKSFDATADGYVRGEGCGFVVLKTLSQALQDGDRVWALLRGSAINHDGRTTGLTVPNVHSQERLLRAALRTAQLTPAQVRAIEAHGTGTPLGDPIELSALDRVYHHSHTSQQPLWIGSAKSNLGHLEAAAGMAGLIKSILAIHHRALPMSLHFETPNPNFNWHDSPLAVLGSATEWPKGEKIISISSFGFSGTNANVIMSEPSEPMVEQAERTSRSTSQVICLSAKSVMALRQSLSDAIPTIAASDAPLPSIAAALSRGRDHFAHRLAIVASTKEELVQKAENALNQKSEMPSNSPSTCKIAFLFTGQGSQYAGMGKQLFESSDVFRKTLEACGQIWRESHEIPLEEILFVEANGRLNQTQFTQPALFALQIALAELWKSWNIQPHAVLGHSIGEIAAACVAGILPLESCMKFAIARGRMMQALEGHGAMVAVRARREVVQEILSRCPRIALAADNGPESCVLSGLQREMDACLSLLEERRITHQRLQVSHAFHSEQMEQCLTELDQLTANWSYAPAQTHFVSNVTGGLLKSAPGPNYWSRHARGTVRFREGMETLLDLKTNVFLEIGPSPILIGMGQACAPSNQHVWLPSLRRNHDDWQPMSTALARLYELGVAIDWKNVYAGEDKHSLSLPNYPFQRTLLYMRPQKNLPDSQVSEPDNGNQQTSPLSRPALAPASQAVAADTSQIEASVPDEASSDMTTSQLDLESNVPASLAADEHRFQLNWVERAVVESASRVNRKWLVVSGNGSLLTALEEELNRQGDSVTVIDWREVSATQPDDTHNLDAAIAKRCFEVANTFKDIDGVINLMPAESSGSLEGQSAALRALLQLSKAMLMSSVWLERRFWTITRQAFVLADDQGDPPYSAIIPGFLQGLALEARELQPVVLDVPLELNDAELSKQIVANLDSRDHESHIAIRAGKRLVKRLGPVQPDTTPDSTATATQSATQSLTIHNAGCYVVTGGLGGLGRIVALWLAKQKAGHIVLVGRQAMDETLQARLREVSDGDDGLTYVQADISTDAGVKELFASVDALSVPLKGVFHLAGSNRDKAIMNLVWDDFIEVMKPKVEGSLLLQQYCQSRPLDFFCGFSSVVSIMGSPGQANYGVANSFLDALVLSQRNSATRWFTINWGPWANVGMTAKLSPEKARRWTTLGIEGISAEEGEQWLDECFAHPVPQSLIAKVNWARFLRLFPPGLHPSILANYLPKESQLRQASAEWLQLKSELANHSGSQTVERLDEFVERIVRQVLGINDEMSVDRRMGFVELGMDSLMGIELRNVLQQHLGEDAILSTSIVFNYPSIRSLSEYIAREHIGSPNQSPHSSMSLVSKAHQRTEDAIAIIGCGLRFPGGIRSLDSFWKVLRAGGIVVGDIPMTRWDAERYYDPDPERPGMMNTRWAGIMDDIDRFDAKFFGISPREAIKMDPQHRIILETVWEAIENAAIPASNLAKSATGVYVGIGSNDYASLLSRHQTLEDIDAYLASGNAQQLVAGRVSHFFDFQGPSLAIDTACSSSMVALHLACESLRSGETDMGLAGGVNLLLAPEITISLSKAHMMAPDGLCKTFSSEANGYVRSEGCGIVVLKRLDDAMRAGNRILGIVRATSVNHDGRCSAVTVPNGQSQYELVKATIEKAHASVDDIAFVETHGTGTALGDPIEVEALGRVFRTNDSAQRVLIGSVKANLGHLESAAGVAGILKVLAMGRYGEIPPQPAIRKLNPRIEWDKVQLDVAQQVQPWPQATRLAGVSSFSFGGTNAHAIIECPTKTANDPTANGYAGDQANIANPFPIIVSAKTKSSLAGQVKRILEFAQTSNSLADLSYTLACGREAFAFRIGFVTENMADCIQQLKESHLKLLDANHQLSPVRSRSNPNCSIGNQQSQGAPPEDIATRPDTKDLLASAVKGWLDGSTMDWQQMLAGRGSFIDLPTYAFDRERYWIDQATHADKTDSRTLSVGSLNYYGKRILSPGLKSVLFQNELAASSALLRDHKIYSMVVVPGAYHVAAVLSAASSLSEKIELREIAFSEVMVLPEEEHRLYNITFDPPPEGNVEVDQQFIVYSSTEDAQAWSSHCSGLIYPRSDASLTQQTPPVFQGLNGPRLDRKVFYGLLAAHGIQLGNAFQWLEQVHTGDGVAMAEVRIPSDKEGQGSVIPAGLLDSFFQVMAGCLKPDEVENHAYIPVKVERLALYQPITSESQIYAQLRPAQSDGLSFTADLQLFSKDGRLLLELQGVTVRRAPKTSLMQFAQRQNTDVLYETRWIEQPLVTSQPASSQLVDSLTVESLSSDPLLADLSSDDSAPVLAKKWHVVSPVACEAFRLAQLLAGGANDADAPSYLGRQAGSLSYVASELVDLATTGDVTQISVVCYFPAATQSAASATRPVRLAYVEYLLNLVQSLHQFGKERVQLVVVTNDSFHIEPQDAAPVEPAQRALFGAINVLRFEMLAWQVVQLDLSSVAPTDENGLRAEMQLIGSGNNGTGALEPTVCLRGSKRFVPRLDRLGINTGNSAERAELDLSGNYTLIPNSSGLLSALGTTQATQHEPGPGEIAIEVKATGLNFRDVLNAMNLYPGDPGPLGVECAGVVTALGSGVTGIKVDDAVIALAPGCFSKQVRTDARLVAPLPAGYSMQEGAALPVTYLTADYALRKLSRLQNGETILIHAASGGVGLCAIAMAQSIGARIIATAGSPTKREFLKSIGITHVFDSRSLEFSRQVMEVTDGQGVDVVLNSLAGEAIARSVDCLAPRGRFVEIGKIGLWSPAQFAQARPEGAYFIFALDQHALEHPGEVGQVLDSIVAELSRGELPKLRTTEFEMSQVHEAFHFMAKARHIGKIVVTHHAHANGTGSIRPDATYIVTGGAGGIGLLVARWLVERGAGRVALLGRRPATELPDATNEIIKRLAPRLVYFSADVADAAQMYHASTLLGELPIKGIMHAAGVLDDDILLNQNAERLQAVALPKVEGAWNLHDLTAGQELDFFLLFSSIAPLLGSHGQGTYAAANSYLDGFAAYRQSLGLPTTSINWGPWQEAGMATRSASIASHWNRVGLGMLTTDQAFYALERAIQSRRSQVVAMTADWNRLGEKLGSENRLPILTRLIGTRARSAGPSQRWQALVKQIGESPVPQRRDMLLDFMCNEARDVLALPADFYIDPSLPFNEFGFDSLMAVELANRLANESGIHLPATTLFDHPTMGSLADFILSEKLGMIPKQKEKEETPEVESVEDLTERMIREISAMSDEEIGKSLKP